MTSFSALFSLVFVVIIGTTTAADSSRTYDWTEQICCGGVVSSKSPRPYDTNCCGNSTSGTAYSSSQQLCCYDYTTDSYTVAPRASSNSYCCGTKSYDYTTQICCIDQVYNMTQTGGYNNMYCCGNQSYDYYEKTCCYNEGNSVLVNAEDGCPIDENSCYNTPLETNKICCSIWDYTSQKYTYQVNDYTGYKNPQCCGLDKVYDYSNATCCSQWNADGTIQYGVSPLPVNWNCWYNWYWTPSCCGLTAYNSQTSLCCSSYDPDTQTSTDTITDYPFGYQTYDFQCCGSTAYNSTADACCYDSKSTTVPKNGNANALCCGTTSYDSSNQDNQCCNNNDLYNVTTEMCCGTYPNYKKVEKSDPYDNQCCGEVTYNVGREMCCDGTLPVPRPTATSTCCGENYSGCGYYYYPYY